MNVLDRKLLRELTRSWALVLAVISIMAVGVTCFVGLQSVHRNLTGARRNYYDQCRMADFWIDVKKVPVVELDAVAKLPGIREIRPRIQYAVTVDLEEVRQPINGLVLSLPTKRASVVNDIILRQGDYFSDKRRNEVIVNDAFARRHRLYPGSRLHLLLNNRREELFIVGTAISCEFTYLIGPGTFVPDPEHFGVFYVKQEFAEEVFDLEGAANQIVGRFAPGEKMGKESLRQAETLLDSYGVLQVTPLKLQSSNQFLTGEIDQIGTFATIFPTIFLIVAALVLNVLMLRLARQQRTVIGTLKAIGYSDRQVFLHFLKFGLIVGLIAGLLGGVGGYFDSLLMTTMYSWFFQFPNLRNEFSGQAYAIGIGLALSCSWIGSWYGSRAALALPPAQAMRPEPPRQGRAILLERATWLWGRLNASWRMTARNLFRNRLRTGMGIFSATMGASLMINGFMLVEATRFMIDFHFFRLSTSDIDLAFDEEQGIEAIDELKHLPGVDLAEPALAVSCNLKHGPYQRKTVLTGLLPQPQLTTPRDTAGEKLRVPDDGVLLTQRLADLLHARRGDRITMVPVKGGRRPIELQVVEIGDSYIGISAYANIHTLSRAVEEELVAYLDEELAPDHRARVEHRLAEDARYREKLQHMQKIWSFMMRLILPVLWQKPIPPRPALR